jgi:two-component system, OmpR family, response regulator RegX3
LLICESEDAVRQALVDGLLALNVEVICANDGARALLDVGRRDPDIVLIAANLPPMGSAAVIKAVREISDKHIIVGAGDGESDLTSRAVEAGADRIVARPYSVDELRAMLLNFRSSADLDAVPLQVGLLKIDPLAYEVFFDDHIVPMPVRELEVLLYLINHRDRFVTVRELHDALWGREKLSPNSNSAAVAVNRLRSRFAQYNADVIKTVRRRGYRFCPPQVASAPLLSRLDAGSNVARAHDDDAGTTRSISTASPSGAGDI